MADWELYERPEHTLVRPPEASYLDCLLAVQTAADVLGHAPRQPEYIRLGQRPNYLTVRSHLADGGPWETVLRVAGLEER